MGSAVRCPARCSNADVCRDSPRSQENMQAERLRLLPENESVRFGEGFEAARPVWLGRFSCDLVFFCDRRSCCTRNGGKLSPKRTVI